MIESTVRCDAIEEDRMEISYDPTTSRLCFEIYDDVEEISTSLVLTDTHKVKQVAQVLLECLRHHVEEE